MKKLHLPLSALGIIALTLSAILIAQPHSASARTAHAGPTIVVGHSEKNDVSPPLRSIRPIPPSTRQVSTKENSRIPLTGAVSKPDTVVQHSSAGAKVPITPGVNFAGMSNTCGCTPPDTNGEAGSTQYLQMVNVAFQVFSKTGTSLYGPADIATVWTGFGGPCATSNAGDPVVVYDQMANRWLISQFTDASPYYECVAVSQTSDATGSWYRYAFQLMTGVFPDYPKLAVWPDAYYMTVDCFPDAGGYTGPRPYAFDRSKMLLGLPATMQTTSDCLGSSHMDMLPADLDGSTLPATGSPDLFLETGSTMNLYKFHVDWLLPINSTWTQSATITPAGFSWLCANTADCIPQPGTSERLDGLGDRIMFRLAYRNLGDHDSLVVTQSVDVGSGQAGVRWYEIRNPESTPSIYQQGTYAPDSDSRWMGSVAMDRSGNIAAGYSVSSSTTHPSIRYAVRAPGDPLGMLEAENSIYAGTGHQGGSNRWGDYSDMTVDPVNDCTFWYTTEYNDSNTIGWHTRVASFKITACGGSPPTPPPPARLGGKVDYPTGTSPSSLTGGDFNNDGNLDLATANQGTNNISVLLNNGNGSFQPKADYNTGSTPGSVTTGDFNGDGNLDLAVVDNGSNQVSILLGKGDGSFQTQVPYTTGTAPTSVTTGDFNGDGNLDLAVTNQVSNTVSILLGNGDGTFQPKADYTTGTSPASVITGDFNDDGRLDLAVANSVSNTVSILIGNANGTFQSKADYTTGATPKSVAAGDFDGDGNLDLAVANSVSNSVSVLFGNGNGTFNPKTDYTTGLTPSSVTTADLNWDGILDLGVANSTASSVSTFMGFGDGTFQPKVDHATGTGPASVIAPNLHSRGTFDLAVANQAASTVSVLLNSGPSPLPFSKQSALVYTLTGSDGTTWWPMDTTNLQQRIVPACACSAVVTANSSLWTNTANLNQDIGIEVSGGQYGPYPGKLVAWEESGSGSNLFSPNAAAVRMNLAVQNGVAYTITLVWKSNLPTSGQIWASAGKAGGARSPTTLQVEMPGWA